MNETLEFTLSCPVYDSFRVAQIAGMFDVPLDEKLNRKFRIEVPPLDSEWKIGLILGPSGSGKSSVAKVLFGERVHEGHDWPPDRSVLDCFGDAPVKEITGLLTSVGFSSPPSWVKPYRVLSNGERFRCDLARALFEGIRVSKIESERLVVFDEFTSVVDRNVAKIGSAAVSRGIRSGITPVRFVAVTCHYDVAEWLEPEWVLDMATGTVARRLLRRPRIEIRIFRCSRDAWKLFAKHHYLSAELPNGCRCYMAAWEEVPVAFCAVVSLMGARHRWRISRIVTLPDFQGIGIGGRVIDEIAAMYGENGERMNITGSHPSMIGHCKKSPKWRTASVMRNGSGTDTRLANAYKGSAGRAVVSFEYKGD